MAALVTVRFLDRPGDRGLAVPPRTARRLMQRHRATSYVCCVSRADGFGVDVLDRARHLPPDTAEVWLLPREHCRATA